MIKLHAGPFKSLGLVRIFYVSESLILNKAAFIWPSYGETVIL